MEILELLTDPTAKPDCHIPRSYLPLSSLPPDLLCLHFSLSLFFFFVLRSSHIHIFLDNSNQSWFDPPMEYHFMWGILVFKSERVGLLRCLW